MTEIEHDVAAIADLAEGKAHPVKAGNESILLTRFGPDIHAVGATCPHAGAPLIEGVQNGDRIVCPWHKATFCLRSGTMLEPPAVDDLPAFSARVQDGRVLVTVPPRPRQAARAADDSRCFLIVGGGAAGAMAAQTLRQNGFGGRIVMLDRENRVPYDRTILSKYVLSGEKGGEKSPLQSQAFYRDHAIDRVRAEVIHFDAEQKRVTCADGQVWSYDKALIATGGIPRRPDLPGVHLRNVFLLRSRADADAVLASAESSRKAVILGASFIGMEVAASLRERGLDVTVVAPDRAPFEKQLGPEIGSVFTRLHQTHGVSFRLGTKVSALRGNGTVQSVLCESGAELDADLVVLGFGVRPATDFLTGLNRAGDQGIDVGADLHAGNDVYAAGDIARFPLYGSGSPARVEHWRVAQQHGRVAALNMLGGSVRYQVTPVFWTIQYLKRLDYIGHANSWDDVVVHGDLQKPEFLAYYVKDGHVSAAVGFDRDQETAALIELFNQRHDWTADELGSQPSRLLTSD